MNQLFYEPAPEHFCKEQLIVILQDEITKSGITFNIDDLKMIYHYACVIYAGIDRYSGDEYITHPLNVAIILAQMGAEITTIYVGLLCDALKITNLIGQELDENIPDNIKDILIRLDKFDINKYQILEDESVIMIKLADRLHNMRTIQYIDEKRWKEKAKETIQLFLPIANKLENQKLSLELGDLAVKYI